MYFTLVETSFGHIGIVYRDLVSSKVVAILLPRTKKESLQVVKSQFPEAQQGPDDLLGSLKGMLIDYFDGVRVKFPLNVLDLSICYPFQIKVLKAEWSIPYGKTASYRCVANKIHSNAYRAVGNALARNPFPIIIPCHRAIRSDRTLGGFQGGLKMKRRILKMEGVEFDSLGRVVEEYVQPSLDPLYDYFQSSIYLNNFNGTF
ncbi:MAG: methylated-DNA--[protein]-cysteine S-methyltransferase [Candidatus Thorarchaeota archaeon]|nr:MAG: methylated-DNA--[protein]-cysteine S-methyltransferase [Candidatus Thorarchaeota archaeon]